MPSHILTRTAGRLLIAAVAFVTVTCATNPVTGRPQLSLISESDEITLGKQASQEVEQTIGLVEDADLQAYVRRIGMAMATTSQRPSLPWTFGVVDDPTPNAFALPGGFIYITRGMATLMSSEAELAAVLGHEIGHVTAKHSVASISQQQLAQIGLGVGSILVPRLQQFQGLVGTGLGLLFLQHGRDAERQADDLGFQYASARGYAMSEMADVFRSLERLPGSGRSALPSFLSTHPSPAERVKTIEQKAAAQPTGSRGSIVREAEYLRQVDGLVYGEDPRQGFFRDGQFLHPDLRFQFSFPRGWKGQNMKQAVLGTSGNQDAALQLTIVRGAPEAAARRDASVDEVGAAEGHGHGAQRTLGDRVADDRARHADAAHLHVVHAHHAEAVPLARVGELAQVALAARAEREVAADAHFLHVQRADEELVDEAVGGPARELVRERHDQHRVDAHGLQQLFLLRQGDDLFWHAVGRDDGQRMGMKGDDR
jgi:Zn-dependent protease with chaperone function